MYGEGKGYERWKNASKMFYEQKYLNMIKLQMLTVLHIIHYWHAFNYVQEVLFIINCYIVCHYEFGTSNIKEWFCSFPFIDWLIDLFIAVSF